MISTQKIREYATDSFHKSRIETGLETTDAPSHVLFGHNRIPFNEDCANIYLVNVLVNYASRSFDNPHFCPNAIDLVERIDENPMDTRNKYEIYKATADTLLLIGSVFDPDRIREDGIGTAQTYYRWASAYRIELDKGHAHTVTYSPLVLTLKRISDEIRKYTAILRHLGTHYFHMNITLPDESHDSFMTEVILEQDLSQFKALKKLKEDDPVLEKKVRQLQALQKIKEDDPSLETTVRDLVKEIIKIRPNLDLTKYEN